MSLITFTSLRVSIFLFHLVLKKLTPFKSLVHEENTFTNKKNLMQFCLQFYRVNQYYLFFSLSLINS